MTTQSAGSCAEKVHSICAAPADLLASQSPAAALPLSGTWSADHIVVAQAPALEWSAAAHHYADAQWAAHLTQHPRSFNGNLASLASVTTDGARLRLAFRPVDFRTYVASRHPAFHDVFPELCRADPLGLTVIIVTADEFVIATQRALHSDQNAGQLYLVGGYMELNEAGLGDPLEEAMREVQEELGLHREQLRAPQLIGLSYDERFCHPEAYFLVHTECSFAQVKVDADRAQDGHEHADVIAIAWNEFIAGAPALARHAVTWSYEQARMHAQNLK